MVAEKKIAYKKVKKVILSCLTSTHLEGADKLIQQFDTLYNDFTLTKKLQDCFIDYVHSNLKYKKNINRVK